jgi:hypothetical protein
MRIKHAALGLTFLGAGLGAGGLPALAQTSLTASLPGMMGGTGSSPHGTGFSGTLGDPDYYIAGSDLPESEGHYPGPYGTMGTVAGFPNGLRPPAMQYTPAPPMQYNWINPYPR